MVTTAILNILWLLLITVTAPIRLLPDANLPSAITDSISTVSGYISAMSDFLPMTTILAILAFSLVFEAAYFSYKIIYWVIKKIPFIS